MPAPKRIIDLVNSFKENLAEYKSSKYNETQVRQQFIDPFFEELGWDVGNKENLPEAFREVMLEDSLKIEGRTKAPDYAFRLNGQRIFFVEAKKPAVHLEIDKKPAFQVRRYGWSAGLNVCLLTDFEEFVVFDTRIKPNIKDKASVSRIQMYRFTDYIEKWDEIYNLFSKQAIINNSLAKLVQSRKTRGIQKIDDDFLKQMEKWREVLAKEIRFKNKAIITTEKDLNFAVQSTIDRILFLRIAEDNNMEEKGNLQRMAGSKGGYKTFMQFCRSNADVKYNSGLFHFADKREGNFVDTITPKIEIGDRTFKKIIDDLYYPNPYAFDAIENDILGSVYEQFLGKVIKLSNGKVEEKPEVRKAGGVYYTPKYIVDYIVKNTIGEWLKGKTPKQAEKLTVCDPACGSGSFLSVAYKFLLDWNLKEYLKDTKKYKKKLVQTSANNFRLSLEEKKTILTNNIYGVDIDHQAVEVAKLSLLLKVLEGESGASIKGNSKHILPDLSSNIKCGNSLIGTDFYAEQELSFEEKEKVNCFDWKTEFPHIFKPVIPTKAGISPQKETSGFDCVIGNPPYVTTKYGKIAKTTKDYYSTFYETSYDKIDLYILFIEKSIKLVKTQGLVSFITPWNFMGNFYSFKIRKFLLDNTKIKVLNKLPPNVFVGAIVDNVIFVLEKNSNNNNNKIILDNMKNKKTFQINQNDFLKNDKFVFSISTNKEAKKILEKMNYLSVELGQLAINYIGIMTGNQKTMISTTPCFKNSKPVLSGREIFKWGYASKGNFVNFDKSKIHSNDNEKIYLASKKILLRKTGKSFVACLDTKQFFTIQSLYNIVLKEKRYNEEFILGLLNSKLFTYIYNQFFITNPEVFPYIKRRNLDKLPIPKLDLSKKGDKENHDKMVKLVEQMLALKKQEQTISPTQKQTVQREIKAIDNQIDQLTYKLYNLTESEIKIVETE